MKNTQDWLVSKGFWARADNQTEGISIRKGGYEGEEVCFLSAAELLEANSPEKTQELISKKLNL